MPGCGSAISTWAWTRSSPGGDLRGARTTIDPTWQGRVSEAYGKLSPNARSGPFPGSSPTAAARDAISGGHRRTCDRSRRSFAMHARKAAGESWHPLANAADRRSRGLCRAVRLESDLSYEGFTRRSRARASARSTATRWPAFLMHLESLGPRWTGGPGQVECGALSVVLR